MKGVIDRIENGIAVVLIGENEEAEIQWPVDYLPDGAKEGSILNIEVELNKDEVERKKKKSRELINKLKNKNM
ncbi:MAG: DUF3006 domain-containing protein [Bacillota bacterium]